MNIVRTILYSTLLYRKVLDVLQSAMGTTREHGLLQPPLFFLDALQTKGCGATHRHRFNLLECVVAPQLSKGMQSEVGWARTGANGLRRYERVRTGGCVVQRTWESPHMNVYSLL